MGIRRKGGGAKAGDVKYHAANAVPAGWLECNGATISRTAYAALFAAIGVTYGAGDGATTFKIPDLRGEFIRGYDNGRGVDAARAFGSAQGFAMQNATGSVGTLITGSRNGFISGNGVLGTGNGNNGAATGTTGSYGGSGAFDFDLSRQVQTATETRGRNVAMLPCIKF